MCVHVCVCGQYIPCRTEADMVATLDRVCGDKRDPATGEDIEVVEALVYDDAHLLA
jgi:hypothetical protein